MTLLATFVGVGKYGDPEVPDVPRGDERRDRPVGALLAVSCQQTMRS